MSGNPRSRMMRSGCWSVIVFSASAPVSASCTTKPSSSRPARRNRRICTSSSTTRTTGEGSVIGVGLGLRSGQRQMNGYHSSEVRACAFGLHGSTVGAGEGLRDPQAQAGTGGDGRVASGAKEALADTRLLVLGQAGALVVDRQHHVAAVAARLHDDGRSG